MNVFDSQKVYELAIELEGYYNSEHFSDYLCVEFTDNIEDLLDLINFTSLLIKNETYYYDRIKLKNILHGLISIFAKYEKM